MDAISNSFSEADAQIAQLISPSAAQVSQCVDLVLQTAETLSEIDSFVSEVADLISNIAAGAGEQANGSKEITSAVSSLSDIMQKSAAVFEETMLRRRRPRKK